MEKVIGVMGDSNFGGLEVLSLEPEKVKFRWNYGTPGRVCCAIIRDSIRRGPYFITRGRRVYFDEVLRV